MYLISCLHPSKATNDGGLSESPAQSQAASPHAAALWGDSNRAINYP